MYVDVTRQGDIKNVIKRGGHRACFHATMLTNTVITVTCGDLRAKQISTIIFQCGVLYHLTFVDCLFIYVPEKMMASNTPALLNNIFIL